MKTLKIISCSLLLIALGALSVVSYSKFHIVQPRGQAMAYLNDFSEVTNRIERINDRINELESTIKHFEWVTVTYSNRAPIQLPCYGNFSHTQFSANTFEGAISIHLGAGVTGINSSGFEPLQIGSVSLGAGIRSIGAFAFNGCNSLTNVYLSSGIEGLMGSDFRGCAVERFILQNANEGFDTRYRIINWMLYDTNGIGLISGVNGDIVIPHPTKVICEGAFMGRMNLRSVSISDSVEEIKEYAFAFCANLKAIRIPAGVSTIGDYAFDDSGITNVVLSSRWQSYDKRKWGLSNDCTFEYTSE